MKARRSLGRGHLYGAAIVVAAAAYGVGYQAQHSGFGKSRLGAGRASALDTGGSVVLADAVGSTETEAPVNPLPESSPEGVILAQRKRIMGRLRSLEMVSRVATNVRPYVDRAIEQPAIQGDLRALASSAGMSLVQYKAYFKGKQEADLLLESGGDPNARSVADAIGLAQFMPGTGQRCGLRVNLAASNALSRKINSLEQQMAWLEQQPVTWARALPPELKKSLLAHGGTGKPLHAPAPAPQVVAAIAAVPPAAASTPPPMAEHTATETAPAAESTGQPAAPLAPATAEPSASAPAVAPVKPAPIAIAKPESWTRDQWLQYRRAQWHALVTKRRTVDERFDPKRAVMVQTRYLVGLTRRYGSVDWALQAYHGGEGGVDRTVRLFVSSPGAMVRLASRGAGGGHSGLSYADLYRSLTPTSSPAAFSYLFGRSDDHRYYWWKVLMAERALNLYRKDPAEFQRQWKALQPGVCSDAAWYPDPTDLQFKDPASLREAYLNGTLVALPGNAGAMGLHTEALASLEPESAGLHKGLRPEGMGALLRVAHIYRSYGGGTPLTVLSLVQSNEYRQRWNSRYPPPRTPPGVPKDPEYHSTGLTFDIERPAKDWDRKVLEYSLGRLYDSLRVSWRLENGAGTHRYHVVVNPAYKGEMVEYYHKLVR